MRRSSVLMLLRASAVWGILMLERWNSTRWRLLLLVLRWLVLLLILLLLTRALSLCATYIRRILMLAMLDCTGWLMLLLILMLLAGSLTLCATSVWGILRLDRLLPTRWLVLWLVLWLLLLLLLVVLLLLVWCAALRLILLLNIDLYAGHKLPHARHDRILNLSPSSIFQSSMSTPNDFQHAIPQTPLHALNNFQDLVAQFIEQIDTPIRPSLTATCGNQIGLEWIAAEHFGERAFERIR